MHKLFPDFCRGKLNWEFLSSDGASYYLELTQDAGGEGLDLGDNEMMEELQEEIIEYLENK